MKDRLPDEFEALVLPFGLSTLLFALSMTLGFLTARTASDESLGSFGPSAKASHLDFVGIVLNNTFVLVAIVLGSVTFGLTAMFLLYTTGAALGSAVRIALEQGFDPLTVGLLVVPHGVLELPAFFLASAIGFDTAWGIIAYLRGSRDRPLTAERAWRYAELILVAFGLIIVAAWVEAAVTIPYARGL
ncbi:stage II sporulation protein M [Halorussus salilacus]|uniref:stage II sporulation protein M n=1 Tax=Halorussus salilacus TaxID=2953750 RepID=UPI0020A0FE04|nr:stage II sporulation protein M [Halorussus salilacus]USZ66946.1 stage II sporulation protein M [Halorussus salilacus]